ncbi:MAG: glycosyltransferase family 39 protein, partial [Pyrinomonadaceae bacterium]
MTTRAENAASPEALAGDSTKQRKRAIAVACAVLFLLSVGVRLLVWFNTAGEINKPLSVSTGSYVHDAHILLRGDVKTFLGGPNPPVDANILAHPPGYALLMTAVFAVHDSMNSLRVVQVILSSAVPVLMLLIAAQFLSWRAALLAGVLGALSPQLAYNSLLLLPDNLAVLPILLALWFLLRGGPSGNWTGLIVSGALLGVSVWFRANVLLLPVFVAAAAGLTLLPPGRRWRSAVIVVAALLVIAP